MKRGAGRRRLGKLVPACEPCERRGIRPPKVALPDPVGIDPVGIDLDTEELKPWAD